MQTKFVYGGIFLTILINLSLVTCHSNAEKKAAYYKILPMCSKENIYDIKDLYNPIQIGLQILKRGFCLPFKIPDEMVKEDKEAEEISINENIVLINQENITETKDMDMGIKLPIVLPDGFCAFDTGNIRHLKKNKNEHIKCEINGEDDVDDLLTKIETYAGNNNKKIYKKYEEDKNKTMDGVLKLNITFYVDANQDENYVEVYYDSNGNNTFLSLDIIFRKSVKEPFGNIPGLNYGDPLIKLQEKDGSFKVPINYIRVIPYGTQPGDVVYNPFVDNSLTFQDTIITSFPNVDINKIGFALNEEKYSKIMNPSFKDLENWKKEDDEDKSPSSCSNSEFENTVIFNFLYTELGAVNNPQKVLLGLKQSCESKDNVKYLFINFLKKENSKDYWNAPGPRVSTEAKNIMYPFKIGSSNYKSSTSK